MNVYSYNDIRILDVLVDNNCNSPMVSMEVQQVAETVSLSHNKIRNTLELFRKEGICEYGCKNVRRKTFFVTEHGFDFYEKQYGEQDELE